jgi:hypothetical protein
MAINLLELQPYLTLIGILISLIPAIIYFYVQIYLPNEQLKNKEKESIKEENKMIYEGLKNLYRSISTFNEKDIEVNVTAYNDSFEYYIKNYKYKDEIYDNIKLMKNQFEELYYLFYAGKYIIDNEIIKAFDIITNKVSRSTIDRFIKLTQLSYLNGNKITEETLKEIDLNFYKGLIKEINEEYCLSSILIQNNKKFNENILITRYIKKKSELISQSSDMFTKIINKIKRIETV